MPLPKYVAKRNGVYQFVRRVPKDVSEKLGVTFWRESLRTDSLAEAERLVRSHADRTDTIISAIRDGTYRELDDEALTTWAIGWSHWYEQVTASTLPVAILGSRFPDAINVAGQPIGDEEPDPIIRSRDQLAEQVHRFIVASELRIEVGSPDWERLIDLCQDEYHWGNPEVTGSAYFGALGPSTNVRDKAKLSSVFLDFSTERTRHDADNPITESSLKDYKVAVDRFIELFGDKDVETVTREDAEQYRALLRRLPARPPDRVRGYSLEEQAAWADDHDHRRLARETVAKLMTGMLSILHHAHLNTSVIRDRRGWENPFLGFAGSGRRSSSAKRLPFQHEHIPQIFDASKYRPRKPSHFWVPLILCFTGARRDEVSQLHLSDVALDAEIPHIRITDKISDSIDIAKHPEAAKRLKTWSSERVAPLHPTLLALGLDELVEWAISRNEIHLFPDLPHEKGGDRSNKLSTSFTKHLRNNVGLSDPRYVLHSFRHSFEMMVMRSKVSDDKRKLTLGRYVGNDSSLSNYVIHFREDVAAIKEHVHDQITFPEVDVEGLKARHLQTLTYQID